MARLYPLISLAFLAGFLAEVGSTNIPLYQFMHPKMLALMFLAYGIPVILLRDWRNCFSSSVGGLLLLGLAYGILNEGIVARTLTQLDGGPVTAFAGYQRMFGVSIPWALFIVPWHALHSVTYPILLVDKLFPQRAVEQWLSVRFRRTAAAVLAVLCLVYLLPHDRPELHPAPQFGLFFFYMGAMVMLIFSAAKMQQQYSIEPALTLRRPVVKGLALNLAYIAQFIFVDNKVNLLFIVFFDLIIIFLVSKLLTWHQRDRDGLVLFAAGDYIGFSLFAAFLCIATGRYPDQAALGAAIIVSGCVLVIRKIARERKRLSET